MCAIKNEIPKAYLERMRLWLGDEFQAFLAAYQQEPLAGLRVNTLKVHAEEFQRISPFHLQPVGWCPAGFIVSGGGRPGKHPYHAAGLYYLQEPSAMAVVELLDPQPGEKILDLAAAPGGKATHIAARLQQEGLLVANEIHPRRARELAQNLERWGARNVVILNETPQRLADHFGAYFDRVLLDAPCSGEGMFRRSQIACQEWSEEIVRSCAIRQKGLLPQAARLVRPGGRLVYSTCTFSVEENESVICNFLKAHPEFELVEWKPSLPFATAWWNEPENPFIGKGVYRILPHLHLGEGHFMAVLRRRSGGEWLNISPYRPKTLPARMLQNLKVFLTDISTVQIENLRLSLEGDKVYFIPPSTSQMSGLRLHQPGWLLGTFKKERFEPAHAFALGLPASTIHKAISLPADHPQLINFLHGESIHPDSLPPGFSDGWLVVCTDGFPLGWGKASQGVIKNLYPRGLRWV
ncbi:MAG: RsmB/NOP family class I SAM-dependent RNA methyltransferase [Chloroflexota bacterium]